MKALTEFPNFKLAQGLKIKTTLSGEGKTPEEIQANLGETFKLEGDKLKYFFNALEVAGQNAEGLTRVIVATLADGENVPAKAAKVEEQYYIPEFQVAAKHAIGQKAPSKGGPGGKKGGKRSDGPKESPWGLSPEQKAAKKGSAAAKTN